MNRALQTINLLEVRRILNDYMPEQHINELFKYIRVKVEQNNCCLQ